MPRGILSLPETSCSTGASRVEFRLPKLDTCTVAVTQVGLTRACSKVTPLSSTAFFQMRVRRVSMVTEKSAWKLISNSA